MLWVLLIHHALQNSRDHYATMREECAQLTREEKEILLMGQIMAMSNTNPLTKLFKRQVHVRITPEKTTKSCLLPSEQACFSPCYPFSSTTPRRTGPASSLTSKQVAVRMALYPGCMATLQGFQFTQ